MIGYFIFSLLLSVAIIIFTCAGDTKKRKQRGTSTKGTTKPKVVLKPTAPPPSITPLPHRKAHPPPAPAPTPKVKESDRAQLATAVPAKTPALSPSLGNSLVTCLNEDNIPDERMQFVGVTTPVNMRWMDELAAALESGQEYTVEEPTYTVARSPVLALHQSLFISKTGHLDKKDGRKATMIASNREQGKEMRGGEDVDGPSTQATPGDIVTQPSNKIVFNAPYDDKHTYHIKVTNNSMQCIEYICITNDPKIIVVPMDRYLGAGGTTYVTIRTNYGSSPPLPTDEPAPYLSLCWGNLRVHEYSLIPREHWSGEDVCIKNIPIELNI